MKDVSTGIAISVAPHEGRRDLLDLMLDDELWRSVHTSVYGRKPDFPKTALSLACWEEEFARLEYRAAKAYALRQMARKGQTSMELVQTLAEKRIAEPISARVVDELKQGGYFDDGEWVGRYISQQTTRGQGPNSIRQKLRRKGISSELVDEQLTQAEQEQSGAQVIQHLLSTTFKRRNLADHKERQKVIGTLMRRGFALDDIFSALRAPSEDSL